MFLGFRFYFVDPKTIVRWQLAKSSYKKQCFGIPNYYESRRSSSCGVVQVDKQLQLRFCG